MNGHGGKRKGAGRPRKWSFDDVLRIGQACENRYREAKKLVLDKAKQEFFAEKSDLNQAWRDVNRVPINLRSAWHRTPDAESHAFDVEVEVGSLDSGNSPPSRIVTLSTRPPKGTRKRIIKEVAVLYGLTCNQVDNLWQAYRRFEAEE